MNPDQLNAWFQAHKPVALGGAAAAVAGLALYQRSKKAKTGTTTTTAGATVPVGTMPAGSVATGTGYDSTATDLYGALQPELEQILQAEQLAQTGAGGGGVATAPAPVGSPLFAPTTGGPGAALPTPTSAPAPAPAVGTPSYYTAQINKAGGSASYSDSPVGDYTGRIDAGGVPLSQQTYTPIAVGLSGQQALMSQQALPQTGREGPVGTVFVDTDGHRKQVTGYTFNGMPNTEWLN